MSGATLAERELLDAVARGIAAHYARAVRVQDRLDSLDGRRGPLASDELRDEPAAAAAMARELVAEVLRIAGDARLEPLLRSAAESAVPLAAHAARLGASRLAVARRVAELASAGLAERDPETDVVGATALGAAVLDLIDQLATGVAGAIPTIPGGRR